MGKLAPIAERINNSREDIKAEVLVCSLLAGGIPIDDILIRCVGQLDRPRSRDVAGACILQKNSGKRDLLELILNRDGIYDTLPEGMFHRPSADKRRISVPAMVKEYHRHRREEQEARQFFAPFENEFFLQKTFTESKELEQRFQIQQSRLSPPVLEKFGINPEFPRAFTSKLLRLIPYITQITGNMSRTAQIFSLLLGEPVTLAADSFSGAEKSGHASSLGCASLGYSAVAGNVLVPDHQLFRLAIGPVSKKKLLRYINGGWKAKAVQTLIDFIIPIEWDITVTITVPNEGTGSFILNNRKQTDARLGYTTSLAEPV